MNISSALSAFFQLASTDPVITSRHISIYAALLQCATQQQTNKVTLFAFELMKEAKISCGKTYYRAIRELSDLGYLEYQPSFNRNRRSLITLSDLEEPRS